MTYTERIANMTEAELREQAVLSFARMTEVREIMRKVNLCYYEDLDICLRPILRYCEKTGLDPMDAYSKIIDYREAQGKADKHFIGMMTSAIVELYDSWIPGREGLKILIHAERTEYAGRQCFDARLEGSDAVFSFDASPENLQALAHFVKTGNKFERRCAATIWEVVDRVEHYPQVVGNEVIRSRKPHSGDAGYIAERIFRPNGSHIVIYLAEEQEIDVDGKYAVVCSKHATIVGASSLRDARVVMRAPDNFCDACRVGLAQSAPSAS